MKSSLTGKRFWKDKAFEGSRNSSLRFSEGNRLASRTYGLIDKKKRVYEVFCFLKKRAIQFIKEGKSWEEAEELLIDYLVQFGLVKRPGRKKIAPKQADKSRMVFPCKTVVAKPCMRLKKQAVLQNYFCPISILQPEPG